MSELTTDHYRMLLGLDESWFVDSVDFEPDQKRVVIQISFAGSTCVVLTVQRKVLRPTWLLSENGGIWTPCNSRLRFTPEFPEASVSIAV